MRKLVIAAGIVILSGCAATSNSNYSPSAKWQGANISAVQAKLGSPNIINTSANGNKIYVYTTQSYQSYPSSPTTNVQTFRTAGGLPIVVGTPPRPMGNIPLSCTQAFEVNNQNIVVNVKTSGC